MLHFKYEKCATFKYEKRGTFKYQICTLFKYTKCTINTVLVDMKNRFML